MIYDRDKSRSIYDLIDNEIVTLREELSNVSDTENRSDNMDYLLDEYHRTRSLREYFEMMEKLVLEIEEKIHV